jgi:hypothetical protein
MKDRELIEELEALEEIIGWLEEREHSDLKMAIENVHVNKDEVVDWLNPLSKKVTMQ